MSVPDPTPEAGIYLGRLVKAFGIKGEIKLTASEDFWIDVLASKNLYAQRIVDGRVERSDIHIERYRPHGTQVVLKFEGVDDREGAEAMVGDELFIDEARIDVELPDAELPYQVLGKMVRLEDGRELGRIASVIFSAAHPVYEVRGDDGVVLIPAVPEFVVDRDDGSGAITIRPIPGLIDE